MAVAVSIVEDDPQARKIIAGWISRAAGFRLAGDWGDAESALKLLPEKLRFFSDYRLLLFGLLLVVMMRFRPEGMIAEERRQLEFHDENEELAEEVEEDLVLYHDHLNPDREAFEL